MIKFIEDNHQYVGLKDGSTDWISVTSLIKKYEPKKDWNKIALRYAKKHGLDVNAVKKQWRDDNKRAVDRGTEFHKMREDGFLACDSIEVSGKVLSICRPITDGDGHKISPPQKLEEKIYPELLLFLNSARICGQADYVEIVDGLVNIKDWKTSKEIKMSGYVNWEGIEEKMLAPLTNIPNSNYWHYALQLNTYAYIIRKNNPLLKLGVLELHHIQFDEAGEPSNIQPYILPDLQGPVESMINHYKTSKK